MGFEELIRLVADGEPVDAATVNRPTRQVDHNVRVLRDLLAAADLGEALFARSAPVEPAALPGMPVWWNPDAGRFERAQLALDTDPATGEAALAARAQPWGVVHSKPGAALADVLVAGTAALDVAAAGGGTAAGLYYLSASDPGGLTRVRPSVAVPVLRCDGAGRVLLLGQGVDAATSHRHYRFDLACLPAGHHAPPAPGGRHAVTSPDAALPGWLPASHASFGGRAPLGAAFGYNLAAHPALAAAWPPAPASSAVLDWNRGGDPSRDGGTVQLGRYGQCVVDRHGLWWMSDCYADVPWPHGLAVPGPDESLSQGAGPECPRDVPMTLTLWFTKVGGASDNAAVSSLVSRDPRLRVACEGAGTPARTGPLELSLDLGFLVGPGPVRGASVLKRLDGGTFYPGYVAEGVYALTGNVHLVSDLPTVPRDPGDPGSEPVHRGLVGVGVAAPSSYEIDPSVTRVHGATEEYYKGALYLGLGPSAPSSFVAQFRVPDSLPYASPRLVYRLRLLGRAAGTLPSLTVKAQFVPRPPAGLATPVDLPTARTTLTLPTAAATGGADRLVEASSSPVAVSPGDTVYVEVSRAGTDGYAGQVGVLAQVAYVVEGT